MIDTKTCPRRKLHYDTLDDVVADARRLVEAGATTTGNWSVGQILSHLAKVMELSVDGFDFKAPLPLRFVSRLIFFKRFTGANGNMPPGFQLKGSAAKALLPPETDPHEALQRLERAVEKMKSSPTRADHAFFGKMTVDESNNLNCRHAELHMSFIAEPKE